MKKYTLAELREKAIASFLQTCTYILKIEYGIDDKVKVFDASGTKIESGEIQLFGRPSWCKIRYTKNGRPYIMHNGRRYHMDRTNILQAQ